jgi:hypothetical protein
MRSSVLQEIFDTCDRIKAALAVASAGAGGPEPTEVGAGADGAPDSEARWQVQLGAVLRGATQHGGSITCASLLESMLRHGVEVDVDELQRVTQHFNTKADYALRKTNLESYQAMFPQLPRHMVEMALDYDTVGTRQHMAGPPSGVATLLSWKAASLLTLRSLLTLAGPELLVVDTTLSPRSRNLVPGGGARRPAGDAAVGQRQGLQGRVAVRVREIDELIELLQEVRRLTRRNPRSSDLCRSSICPFHGLC